MLPKYFYDITAPVTLDCYPMGARRWDDAYADTNGDERLILTEKELTERFEREQAYKAWLNRFDLPRHSVMKWQLIQVLGYDHASRSQYDWWRDYQDALFRVFVNPFVNYSPHSGYQDWYMLSPEDAFLTQAYEAEQLGHTVPKRATWKWICPHKDLRKLRMLPVEACRHFKHETTAGKLPEGL